MANVTTTESAKYHWWREERGFVDDLGSVGVWVPAWRV